KAGQSGGSGGADVRPSLSLLFGGQRLLDERDLVADLSGQGGDGVIVVRQSVSNLLERVERLRGVPDQGVDSRLDLRLGLRGRVDRGSRGRLVVDVRLSRNSRLQAGDIAAQGGNLAAESGDRATEAADIIGHVADKGLDLVRRVGGRCAGRVVIDQVPGTAAGLDQLVDRSDQAGLVGGLEAAE